jgi:hypothetical protein
MLPSLMLHILRASTIATLTALSATPSAAEAPSPCSARYTAGAQFPPATETAATLDGSKLRTLLGNKGWGLDEDVTIRALPDAPAPLVLEVKLPEGSIDHKNPTAPMGGMGFRWRPGMPAGTTAACLTYHLWLPPDFPFNKGGKLPGLFGGDGPAGGKDVDGQSGFSARYMWRAKGAGEVYAYIPGKPDGRGESIDRGAWTFARGRWVKMEEEVVLNTPGEPDGQLHVWVDGDLKLTHSDILYRTSPALGIDGVMADIFFGGKTVEWAAPADTFVRLTPFMLAWH